MPRPSRSSPSLWFAIFLAPTLLMAGPKFEKTVIIAATPETVWQAITDPELVKTWHFVPLRKAELKEGGRIEYGTAETPAISGVVSEIVSGKKLVHSFRFHGHDEAGNDGESRVAWNLQATEGGTKLNLTHDGFASENQTFANITGGWPFLLDGLAKAAEARQRGDTP